MAQIVIDSQREQEFLKKQKQLASGITTLEQRGKSVDGGTWDSVYLDAQKTDGGSL